jgi:putative PIN family toxin of toxin-antitoxin system
MAEPIDRVVLDTNVCLDLFVFHDPRCARLLAALDSGAVLAVTSEECRDEWLRVLQYPQLNLDPAARETATVRFDAVVHSPLLLSEGDVAKPPRCRDADDQKFLDLAVRAQARWLLTRDDHLLVLSRRTQRDCLFQILTPMEWMRQQLL